MTTTSEDSDLQLELPLGHAGQTRRLRSADGQFCLRALLVPGGAKVELRGRQWLETGGHMAMECRMHVRVRPPLIFKMSGWEVDELSLDERSLSWCPDPEDMLDLCGEDERLLDPDPDDFRRDSEPLPPNAIQWVYDTAVELLEAEGIEPSERESLSAAAQDLLHATQDHLRGEAIPEALCAAQSFHPGLRLSWFIYSRVATDPTLRMAQMSRVCPGLLILLRAFETHGRLGPALEIADRIVRGERLPMLLRRAAKLWVASSRQDEFDSELIRRQAIWVRLAGPGVPPSVLWRGPPALMVPEDIPRTPADNARWYGFMSKAASIVVECSDCLKPEQVLDLCRFLSHRALEIDEEAYLFGHHAPETKAAFLAGLVAATGRRVNRKTSIERLGQELLELQCGTSGRAVKRARKLAMQGGDDCSFSPFPVSHALPWKEKGVSIELLGDAAAVYAEAGLMGHCVSSYIGWAMMGRCLLLHAEVEGQPLTLRLELSGHGGCYLAEIAGKNDREPSQDERDRIEQCLWEMRRPRPVERAPPLHVIEHEAR